MAQTAGGTYYAASSELVSSWPATSLDLANQLETRFAAKADASSLKIVQVVAATYATQTTSTSTTYAATGLTASITPSSASNKVLVIINQNGVFKAGAGGSTANSVNIRLRRGSTTIADLANYAAYTGTSIENNIGSVSGAILDSPASTSSVTYSTEFSTSNAASTVNVQRDSAVSSIVLMEVKA